jgi:SNF2 family DNA or RNA helicase
MRTGKTKIAIDFAACLELKGLIDAVLVVCPLGTIGVWGKQRKLHLPDNSKLKWYVVNFEGLYDREFVYEDKEVDGEVISVRTREWYPVEKKALKQFLRDHRVLIIVDEAHKIGDASSLQSKELYRLAKQAGVAHRIIMTGTPFHRGKKLLVFGQFKFLDQSVFGTSFSSFKSRYSRHGGFGGHVLLGYLRQKEFRKKIAKHAFVMARVPKVPTQHTVWSYPLEESEDAYAQMANEGVWRSLEAPNPLARTTRLSQIASGKVRINGRSVRVGSEKMRAFDTLIEQLEGNGEEKLVVFSRWLPPMIDIGKVGRKHGYHILPLHGGVPPDVREQRIDYFQESSEPCMFISQTATGALGIDLSAASVEIFYTLPAGLVDFDQDLSRIVKFKDKRTLSYYYLCADGTIEEAQLAALRAGIEFTDTITRHPDLLNYQVSD